MFAVVGVPYAEYRELPRSEYRWLLICLSRYADESGVCFPTIRQLAVDSGFSPASVSRYLAAMREAGVFERERLRGGGRYRYRLAEGYRPRRFGRVSGVKHGVSQWGTREANPRKQAIRFAELPTEQPWEQRIQGWRKSGFWLPAWGSRPDEAGCLAPLSVLRCFI